MESPTSTRRRTCFIEEDDGLVSLADQTQPQFSGNNHNHNNNKKNMISRPLYYTVSSRRRNSLRNLSSFSSSSSSSSSSTCSMSSPRSVVTAAGKYYESRIEEPQQHFLDVCYLCKKRIPDNCDIFMYRGDTPFCSEECRHQQIEMDEAKEKKRNISSIKAIMRKKDPRQSTSPNKTKEDYPFRPGTVAAA
ncbi:hypothetical protein K7X08_032254 [Anisodus acutangulus]|uniref:FLZ-type domain-containing protein n=1 Tax=Anisodus acutangulus TaxID=402998 RepID=A0A9Q1MCB6_9SOLA|nr:hypothetical protein K7X08_032254 [Anisodus acutangulus]